MLKKRITMDGFAFFLVFTISVVESIPYFTFFNVLKYLSMLFLAVFILLNLRFLRTPKLINWALYLYVGLLIISSYLNKGSFNDRDIFLASISFSVIAIETLFIIEIAIGKGNGRLLINTFFVSCFFFCIITDFMAIFVSNSGIYFVGTKFQVSYLHMFLTALYLVNQRVTKKPINSIFILLDIIWSFFIIGFVNCDTGIIGFFFMCLLLAVSCRTKKSISPWFLAVLFCLAFAFLFLYNSILNSNFSIFILDTFFDSNYSLSSRTYIFKSLESIMNNHWYLGYGYGCSYELLTNLIGAPDAQNGLYELIIYSGLIGIIPFVFLVSLAIKNSNKLYELSSISVLFATLIFLSAIEITYTLSFFTFTFLLYVLNSSKIRKQNCLFKSAKIFNHREKLYTY